MEKRVIALFDVDGTLTDHRQDISLQMKEFLIRLNEKVDIGFVGGADYEKHSQQLGLDLISKANYLFSQNGGTAYRHNELIDIEYLTDKYSKEQLDRFVHFVLQYINNLALPTKTSTFIQIREAMINICPIGRDASIPERNAFEEYDRIHRVREKMIEDLKEEFNDLDFTYLIGGQTSFDVVPNGFDKTHCLKFLTEYNEIHFFGDKVQKGGNDYEIYVHPRTIGHHVCGPAHTRLLCEELFF